MPVIISTVDRSPASATAILNTSVQQHRATTTWDSAVEVPREPAEWTYRPFGDDAEEISLGTWVPARTNRAREGQEPDAPEGVQTYVTHWSRETTPQAGQGERRLTQLLGNRAHMLAQAKRLTRFTGEDLVGPDAPLDFTLLPGLGTNVLGQWNYILRNQARGAPTHDFTSLAAFLDSGELLMDLILEDLSDADDLNQMVQVLAEYQLVLDPYPANFGDLAFLLDAGDATELKQIADWSEEEQEDVDPATQPISCRYLPEGERMPGPLPTLVIPDASAGSPPLPVREPADNRAEAELEIALQRARLTAEHLTAGASVLINPSIKPLDALTAYGRTWKVMRVTHRWPAGSAPEMTELQLRAI